MTKFDKQSKAKVEAKLNALFSDFDKVLHSHGLGNFSMGEFKIGDNVAGLNCPCGTENVMLPSGKIVKRCKKCPPSSPVS